jgi:hypothetical protein
MKWIIAFYVYFFSLAVTSQEVYFEDVTKEFMENLLRTYCPTDGKNESLHASCMERVERNIRSVKLARFYNQKNELQVKIDQAYRESDNFEKRPQLLNYLDSYFDASNYYEKLHTLQTAADSPQVHKICMIGFGFGFSALNFLIANPSASLLIFDNVNQHLFLSSKPMNDAQNQLTSFNLLSKVSLQTLIELFPDRIINVFSGNIKHSLSSFQKEFVDKMDCNLLYVDGQQIQLFQGAVQNDDMLNILRNSVQLLAPTYNRFIFDSVQLSNFFPLLSYFQSKINEHIECPPKILSKQKRQCLQKSLTQNLQTITNIGNSNIAVTSTGQCDGNCPNIRFHSRLHNKGYVLTPCVAYYSNATDGLHIEFVFNYENCQLNLVPGPHQQHIAHHATNDRFKGLVFDHSVEMIVSELIYD